MEASISSTQMVVLLESMISGIDLNTKKAKHMSTKTTKTPKSPRKPKNSEDDGLLIGLNDALGQTADTDVLRKRFNPLNPTIEYNVGDEVIVGGHAKSIVIEVHPSKVAYLVEHTNVNNRTGETTITRHWWNWINLEPLSSRNADIFTKNIVTFQSIFQTYSTSIGGILHTVYAFGCNMDPWWQRGLVWSQADKESLLESIFTGIDIGKIVFIHHNYEYSINSNGNRLRTILDGKQRLSTLMEFREGRLLYKGKTYFELHPRDRNFFDDFTISMCEMNPKDDNDESAILEQFYRLNRSGIPVNPEHLEFIKEKLQKG